MFNILQKQRFIRANIVSLIFNILFNLPIALYKPLFYKPILISGEPFLNGVLEILTIFCLNNLLFYLIFQIRYLSTIIITIFFILGGGCIYFLMTFRKLFDIGIIIDFFSVEPDLVGTYVTLNLLLSTIFSGLLGCFLAANKLFEKPLKLFNSFIIANILIIFICSIKFLSVTENPKLIRYIARDYLPYNLGVNIFHFCFSYLPQLKEAKNKINIAEKFPPHFAIAPIEPLKVIMVIGESMRGDLISINGYPTINMPLIGNLPNLISFPDATASSTSTRVSLPYMLTSAIPPNFDQALSEVSIVSMFKALGFTTSWIGSQGAFKDFETTYASIILEADYFVFQPHIRERVKTNKNYDGDLIEVIKERLANVPGNHFMVIHLLGSHWHFEDRYPKDFKELFTPTCTARDRAYCSAEMIINGYYNTISYTDYVLNEIIKPLQQDNVFLLYASDHGFTFDHEGFFGNAYLGESPPQGQLNIGMFIWGSDKFIKENQENYNKILNKKFMPLSHNYIYPSLLGCINANSEVIDQQYNLCY